MKVPMKQPMKVSMRQSMRVGAGSGGRAFLDLNGATSISLAAVPWTPTSSDFEIGLKLFIDPANDGVLKRILSDVDSANERLSRQASGAFQYRYVSDLAEDVLINSAVVASGQEAHVYVISDSTSGVILRVNGVDYTDSRIVDAADIDVNYIGSNNTGSGAFWVGKVWDAGFTDSLTPANSRFYPVDDGAVGGSEMNIADTLGDGSTDAIVDGTPVWV